MKLKFTKLTKLFVATLLLALFIPISYIIYRFSTTKNRENSTENKNAGTAMGAGSVAAGVAAGKCDHKCGAIDPVSDPKYNIKQVILNSLLLEEHLTDPKKLCKDCICKHFMLLDAYSLEALALAGNEVHKYPHMKELPAFYDRLYEKWKANKDNEKVRLDIDTELRAMRKQLMAEYMM